MVVPSLVVIVLMCAFPVFWLDRLRWLHHGQRTGTHLVGFSGDLKGPANEMGIGAFPGSHVVRQWHYQSERQDPHALFLTRPDQYPDDEPRDLAGTTAFRLRRLQRHTRQ